MTIAAAQGLGSPAGEARRLERFEAMGAERRRLRELLGMVGSGEHTSTGLTQDEAQEAMELRLGREVAQARVAAFLTTHRIRRPPPMELAGMLQALLLAPCGERVRRPLAEQNPP